MINIVALNRFLIFFALVIGGFGLELIFLKVFSHKKAHFTLGKYVYFLTLPIFIVTLYTFDSKLNFWEIFVGFAILGTLAEGLIGFFYHKIVGQRLWTYHRFSIIGYTSLLSIPLWGLAGLIFHLFFQIFLV